MKPRRIKLYGGDVAELVVSGTREAVGLCVVDSDADRGQCLIVATLNLAEVRELIVALVDVVAPKKRKR